ncbi:hypothetical protein FM037_17235 [Shewanella psychropiezotolerans]|uniref:Uncharacterized protein n=1 Tax=Shewanella psychropiezotolerans TaxID=2593655 RepID=A0ABX5WZW1_9GAMM|nr:hypothetical protein [Shewanella psychropiezotolerans]QDO84640.1 hypothetical protein FM037_17235 [Shewanella psychropiezotolerans]
MKFREYIEEIDFDGAEIVDVARKDDVVIVSFRKGLLLPSHPAHSKFPGTLDSYEISFFGVTNEEALKYVGVGVSITYSGKIPVESLEHIMHEGNQFSFGGYVEREPWYEWKFNANEYEVRLGNS